MAKLIASYRTTEAGYDLPNTRLLDESGLGNHLPLLAGTPDFTGSFGGKTVWSMTGSDYFGGPNLLHAETATVIMALHPYATAGEFIKAFWSASRNYANTDPGHTIASTPFGDATGTLPNYLFSRFVNVEDSSVQIGNLYFAVRPAAGFVANAWNIITFVWNGETSQVKGRIGTSAFSTAAMSQHYQVATAEEFRLGYRATPLTLTGGRHVGCARVDIYEGDYSLDDPRGYAERIAALIADPAL